MTNSICQSNNVNFVKMYKYFEDDLFSYIIQENVNFRNLREIYRFKKPDTDTQVIIIENIINIVKTLTKLSIIHRDMWIRNFLYDESRERLILIDFEFALKKNSPIEIKPTYSKERDAVLINKFLNKICLNPDEKVIALREDLNKALNLYLN